MTATASSSTALSTAIHANDAERAYARTAAGLERR
jgi:hypothetical protein